MFEGVEMIDTHMHLGYDPLMATSHAAIDEDVTSSGKKLVEYMDKYAIAKCMAMPGGDPSFPKDWDDTEKNMILSKAIQPYKDRIIGCGSKVIHFVEFNRRL